MYKKLISLVLTLSLACTAASFPAAADADGGTALYPAPAGVELKGSRSNPSAPDWSEYDALMKEIDKETSPEKRLALMHRAEDMVMETAAILPLSFAVDTYLQSTKVSGIYSDPYGRKIFRYAETPDGRFRMNVGGEPQVLDPANVCTSDGMVLSGNLFSGLFSFDPDGRVIPDCADEEHPYDLSDDGLVYTFHLREGLLWSDGTKLTAEDFAYSWKRAAKPETGSPFGYLLKDHVADKDGEIDVSAPDERTFVVHLSAPCPYFINLITLTTFFPVKKECVEAADTYGNNPIAWVQEAGFVTNGPYTVKEWKHDDAMILQKNPHWYNAEKVKTGEVDVMLNDDRVAAFAAYSAGNIDLLDPLAPNEMPALIGREDFHSEPLLGTNFFVFNVNCRIFAGKTAEQSINMRKAVSLLIDRDYIVNDIMQKGEIIANALIPDGMSDGSGGLYRQNTDSYSYPFAEERGYFKTEQDDEATKEAIRLLESAGYKFENGKLSKETPLRIVMLMSANSSEKTVAEAVQQDLAEVGIDLDIDVREYNAFIEELRRGNFEFTFTGWYSDYNDPTSMLSIMVSNSGNNSAQFGK